MIAGLDARWIEDSESLQEIELSDPSAIDESSQLTLTVILVVGPPDPNALSYLVPRYVFERGTDVHVGALSANQNLEQGIIEILEVMNPQDIVVFLCETELVKTEAIRAFGPLG